MILVCGGMFCLETIFGELSVFGSSEVLLRLVTFFFWTSDCLGKVIVLKEGGF